MILFEIKSCIDRLIQLLPNAYCVSAECVSNCWRIRIPLPTDAVSVAGRCVSSCPQIRIALPLDTHLPARRYGEHSDGIRIRRRSSTGTTSHAIRQAKNCSRTKSKLFANSLRIVREQFYVCLSRSNRPTDKMVFTCTRSTIVLHGMYPCRRAFEPGYSSPKTWMLFAGNLYAVCHKFLTCLR